MAIGIHKAKRYVAYNCFFILLEPNSFCMTAELILIFLYQLPNNLFRSLCPFFCSFSLFFSINISDFRFCFRFYNDRIFMRKYVVIIFMISTDFGKVKILENETSSGFFPDTSDFFYINVSCAKFCYFMDYSNTILPKSHFIRINCSNKSCSITPKNYL